jgi:uncharacterized membrane protein YraQ (UPF0718 family)
MLRQIAEFITFGLLRLPGGSHFGEALAFFIYDTLKILLLLFIMISVIGFLRTYISGKKVRSWLGGRHPLLGCTIASLFGAVTPFCSCSSVPIFLGFIKAGIPLGVTFAFLVTSPLINEYLAVLMLGFFGLKITAIYIVSGLVLGIVSGLIIGSLDLEKELEKDFAAVSLGEIKDVKYKNLWARIRYGLNEGVSIASSIWLWVIAGVALGAVIHNYVPREAIEHVIKAGGIFTVPLATLLGVPMYGSCTAIVPIAVALFNKGVPLGTALAFMMGVAALSLPEAVILRRAMKLKLIGIFFGIVALGIIIIGYTINAFTAILK